MSRRKQSNPKPLKAGEEEEWGSEGEGERLKQEATTPTPAEASETPPPVAAAPAPKLRVNASLATDPAARVVPKTERPATPSELEYLATLPSALQTAIVAGRLFCVPPITGESVPPPPRKPESSENRQATGPGFICTPCGIKFSSLSTLEAHQTYYCSHRLAGPKVVLPISGGGGGAESEPEDVKPVVKGREEASGGESSTGEPATKCVKSGKQYRCPHCSYSADKKVSLNRHMRMHSSSPASQTGTDSQSDGAHLVDRYCQDCDIRFSSLETFKAHKMHYCRTRHVIKTNKPISAPSSPSDSRTTPTSPGASDTSNHPPRDPPSQPFLALPTNPILIVPYSLFQGASILSGSAVMGLPTQDTACLLLPDGTLQPLAQGLLTHSRPPPPVPSEVKRQRLSSETVIKQSEDIRNKNGTSEPSGTPLDLSVRTREEEGELVIDMEEEDEKENRRSVDNQANIFPSPDPEDIICAPSIPLMLSTSSTCSSPSPAPPSPALSSSSFSTSNKKPQESSSKRQRTDSQSSSPSPKSSPSGTKSPRRTPNGLLNVTDKTNKASSHPKRKSSMDSMSPPKMDSTNNNLTLSSLLLAAAAHSQNEGYPGKSEVSSLPFPPELVSHLTGGRLPGGKGGKPIPAIPGLIPATGRNLPLILPKPPRTPADLMNPATILPLLTSEMALRMAAAAGGDPALPTPQVLVKQGVSKCQECNIVFCKHENYIAHKKHYCSARQLNEPIIVQDDDVKPASPSVSVSPPNASSPPTSIKDTSHSPVSNSCGSISKPTLLQFICAACGIKFTSYDNLTAHQAYYCPKRSSTENEKGSRRCQKCKLTVPMDHVCGGAGGAWKCPCCPVVSPTASAAQKHMDTHTGVKAFLCTICRYKGNTLRGMRTHIRMHFDKRSSEIMEESYITCLLEDGNGGSIEVPSIDNEENHFRKTPENNNARSLNGDAIKVKEEVERRPDEDDEEEYIEVDEVSIKTEPQVNSKDCTDTKTVTRRGEGVVSNIARSLQVQR